MCNSQSAQKKNSSCLQMLETEEIDKFIKEIEKEREEEAERKRQRRDAS